jgi:hypothetical protein
VPASRAYWRGFLKLSFVSCPIALYPATSAAERLSFRQVKATATQRAGDLKAIVDDIRRSGITTTRGIAEELRARGIRAPRGDRPRFGSHWGCSLAYLRFPNSRHFRLQECRLRWPAAAELWRAVCRPKVSGLGRRTKIRIL